MFSGSVFPGHNSKIRYSKIKSKGEKRMKSRTRKLLSIMLAAAMVLSMNTFAFAEPEEDVAPVDTVDITTPTEDDGYSDGYDAGYFKGYEDGLTGIWNSDYTPPVGNEDYVRGYGRGYDNGYRVGHNEGYAERTRYGVPMPTSGAQPIAEFSYDIFKADTKVDVTGDAIKITGLSVNKLTDLRETLKGKAVIQTILTGGKPGEDTYLVNKKDIKVSDNQYETYDIEGMRSPINNAYYDVVELSDGNFLFLEYHSKNDGLGWVAGVQDPIPVIEYTGQRIEFMKPRAKDNKSKKYDLCVDAALVKFADGTIEKIPGVTVASAKVDKNGKDASVSGETITQKASRKSLGLEFKDAEFEEYVKAGNAADLPTFTIKAKAADAAKSSGKAIKAALKAKKYQFAINQKVVTVNIPGAANTSRTDGTLSFNNAADYTGSVDKESLDFGGSVITVSKYNGKKANITSSYGIAGDKVAVAKLKAGKDYTLEKGKLGESNTEVAVIKEFKGNYMYSNKLGIYSDGYVLAFRQSPDEKLKKKFLRWGVFKADGDGFVYSVD